MFLLYDFIFFIYAVVYLPYLLVTQRAYAGYAMRFGFFPPAIKQKMGAGSNIWVHAVSVREVAVIEGLIRGLQKQYPDYQIVATVTTKSGYELAQQRLAGKAIVIPSPLDFSFVDHRFIRLINPKIYIVAETEIWPNLFRALHQRRVPIVLINGRISDGSFGRYQAVRPLLKGVLNQVSAFCMQSQRDADRIKTLGAPTGKVNVVGNVKFDDLTPAPARDLPFAKEDLLWIAGSTHPGEEAIVLDVYKKISAKHPRWRLVLAPRHIERAEEVIALVEQQGFKVVRFSRIGEYVPNAVIVVDTIGQLRSLYALASMVFVGKSLCVGGGHNIIEPAYYAKPVVVGPMMANFYDIMNNFKQGQGVIQATDMLDFERIVLDLAGDDNKRKEAGRRAKAVIDHNQGATQRTVGLIGKYL